MDGQVDYFARIIDGLKDTQQYGYWHGPKERYGKGVTFENGFLIEAGQYADQYRDGAIDAGEWKKEKHGDSLYLPKYFTEFDPYPV